MVKKRKTMAARRKKGQQPKPSGAEYPRNLYVSLAREADEGLVAVENASDLVLKHETAHLALYQYVGIVCVRNVTTVGGEVEKQTNVLVPY